MKNLTNENKIIPVFFATDNNYVPFLAVSIKSLLCNASKDYFYNIHVLTDGISEDNKIELEKHMTPNSKLIFDDVSKHVTRIQSRLDATLRDYYTASIFYRLFIAALYPEYKKAIYLDCDITDVYVSDMTDEEIENWIEVGNVYDKAGAYAIQSKFGVFVDKIDGNYSTVIGFPINKVYQILKQYI